VIDTVVYQALIQDNLAAWLKDRNNHWRVYPAKSLGHNGVPALPDYPYVQYGDGGQFRNLPVRDTRDSRFFTYNVWVYDEAGSFVRIKSILEVIINNVEGINGLTATTGWRVTESLMQSLGEDGYDPVNQQASKRAGFRILASHNP
jgi:hypothetical protein